MVLLSNLLVLAVLILLNAFFAASEIAMISLNDNKLKVTAEEGDKKAILIQKLLKEPSRFLATIQIGITLAGFLASAIASEAFADRLVEIIQEQGILTSTVVIKPIVVVVITLILSYFTLVLGELVPKRLAMQNPEAMSKMAVKPLTLLAYLTAPFVAFLTLSTNFFIRIMGGDPHAVNEENVSEEEIRLMVDVGEEKGTIQEIEKEVINNIFDFDDKVATDIMTHRTEIVSIPIDLGLQEIINVISEEEFSRIPVYENSIDNIVGILHVKDLVKLINGSLKNEFNLREIIRQPLFVPESRRASDLFKDLQETKVHMAVIIDEYGGTAGIVTIEDILEEIVGNIFDEYDYEEELEFEKIDENTYSFDGTISLDEVEKIINVKLPTEEYETLSGYLIGQLGKFPLEGEKPVVELDHILFKVEEIDEKRISRVKACRV